MRTATIIMNKLQKAKLDYIKQKSTVPIPFEREEDAASVDELCRLEAVSYLTPEELFIYNSLSEKLKELYLDEKANAALDEIQEYIARMEQDEMDSLNDYDPDQL